MWPAHTTPVTRAGRPSTGIPNETVTFITSDDPGFQLPNLPALPFGAVYTGTEDAVTELPFRLELDQNYPNPFNPVTRIVYRVRKAGRVRQTIYDMLGRKIATPIDQRQLPGEHTVEFYAGALSSGVYLYRLEAGDDSLARTMTLLK